MHSCGLIRIIIKSYGKSIPYGFLDYKIRQIWKSVGTLHLIYLGYDLFLARFQLDEDFSRIIASGPWFLNRQYLMMRLWQPNFTPATEKTITTAIWACLPGLLLDYYDREILTSIGNNLGKLLKINA